MQQRSEQTRAHICEAAIRLFSQHGYEATGVAEICAAAGVSKGAFYHHFPTKQAVFLDILERWLSDISAKMDAVRQSSPNVPQTLLAMAEFVPVIFRDAEGQLPMFLEYWLHASRDEAVWQATIAPYQRYQELFAELVRNGIREGSFRDVDPEIAARAIVSLAVGMLLQGAIDPRAMDWPAAAKEMIQIMMEGLFRRDA